MVRPLTLTSLMASLGRVDRFALFPDIHRLGEAASVPASCRSRLPQSARAPSGDEGDAAVAADRMVRDPRRPG